MATNPWLAILAAPFFMVACAGPSKSELDAEVRRLCAIDGGVKVYETVVLPPNKFDVFGNVTIPSKTDAAPNDEYYFERETHYYRKGNPELSSSRHRIVRRSDGKTLGEAVRYARGGGDLPGPWQASTFICPDPRLPPSLEKSVFLRGDAK